MSLVPFAVAAPFASRQSPDCTPATVPLALRFHCWLVPPWQSQMVTWVPLLVPAPLASRHLLPYTWSCLPEVYVQRCMAPPQQSHNCTWMPLVVLPSGTSIHRPDWPPTSMAFCSPPLAAYPAAVMLACTAFSVASDG